MTNQNELVITRIFDSPLELVWKAWTNPMFAIQWWGPKNFTTPVCSIDFREGGKYLNCMRSPEGRNFWSTGTYKEIIPLKKLVCTDSFADDKGNVVPASYYGMPGDNWQMELLVTIEFEVLAGKTKMTLTHSGIPAGEIKEMTDKSWNESFDKLAMCIR